MNDEEDRQLQSLMADLEASIATFDERFAAIGAAPGDGIAAAPVAERLVGMPAARGEPPTRQTPPPASPTVASPPPAGSEPSVLTPLLEALAEAAKEKAGDLREENARRLRIATEIGAALRRLADYLHQMTTHLDTLQPSIPVHFAIDRKTRFTNVRWQEGSTRGETEGRSEHSPMRKLTLRVRYAAEPLSLVVPERSLRHFEHELYLMNLSWRDAGVVDTAGLGLGRRIEVDGSIPLQLVFAADIDKECIVLRSRNLVGLGLAAYTIAPSAVDAAVLDALAGCLLGHGKHLPPVFRPLPFNTPDAVA